MRNPDITFEFSLDLKTAKSALEVLEGVSDDNVIVMFSELDSNDLPRVIHIRNNDALVTRWKLRRTWFRTRYV